jgi:hypothetical protein
MSGFCGDAMRLIIVQYVSKIELQFGFVALCYLLSSGGIRIDFSGGREVVYIKSKVQLEISCKQV